MAPGFLNPLALLFAALSIPILILYMLRLRRREVPVSSTLLWRRLLRDREANAPWQRLRSNLLLLLQLLILALLTLALARPFLPSRSVVSGSAVILLDGSASMQATDVSPSRFEAARRAARQIVAGLGAGEEGTVILAGPRPTVLASAVTDHAVLRRALDEAVPSTGPADWADAFALAAAALAGNPHAQAVVISDGALPPDLPALPGETRFVRVGERSDNLALVALAVREGAAGPQAFVRVTNSGDATAQTSVELWTDGALFDVRTLTIPAHGSAGLSVDDLPYTLQVLEARLSGSDPLPLDDTAWAVRSPAAARRVLLVTPGNLFLERAVGMLPGVELTRLAPGQPLPDTPYDLLVHDGPLTTTLPSGNLWLIGAYGAGPTTVFTATALARAASDDPLLRYVDWSNVHVLRAWEVEPPPGARVLVEAEGGPLLFVAERPEGRLAVLTFDLHDSDLPLQVAFPILVANLTGWLLPPGGVSETALHPGDPLSLQPQPEAVRLVVTAPDGSAYPLPVGQAAPTFVATERLGVYRVEQFASDGSLLRRDPFAVNLFDAAESDIAPRDVIHVGQAEVRPASPGREGRQETWPWLAAAALGVMGVEWWAFHRGMGRRGGTR